jgi:hypothetical protein
MPALRLIALRSWLVDRVVNQPSDGVERRVANHLAVVETGSTH